MAAFAIQVGVKSRRHFEIGFGLIRAAYDPQNRKLQKLPDRRGEKVALVSIDSPLFEEAKDLAASHKHPSRTGSGRAIPTIQPKSLPTCENSFTAAEEPRTRTERHAVGRPTPGRTSIRQLHRVSPSCARLAMGIASLLVVVVGAWCSDDGRRGKDNAGDEATESSSPGATSVAEEKPEASGKFDVNRIGQRSIGHGVNLYSLQKERALGEGMASAIDRGTIFVTDPDVNEYVDRLGQKLARNSDAQVPFRIKVIDSPTLRVFALPGGFLYVDKGLIMELESEAELAGLMAHEIGHVAARHATRFATRRYAWNVLTVPLAYLSGPAAIGTKQISPLTLSKFNRDAELEADLLGVEYQYAAGYDPHAFVQALERLNNKDIELRTRAKGQAASAKLPLRGQITRAFANYPGMQERIEKIQGDIATLLPAKNDYLVDTSEFQEVKAKLAWADRPILRRHRAGDDRTDGPVLHRPPAGDSQKYDVAASSRLVTKGRPLGVFGYLPAFPY